MSSNGRIGPSQLSLKDLPWQILWDKEKCALCGKCTAVCPVRALELGVFQKRNITPVIDINQASTSGFSVYYGIRQKTAPASACVGCGMCSLVCPNDAIMPVRNDEADKLVFHVNQGCRSRRRARR